MSLKTAKERPGAHLKLDYYRPWEGVERATDHYILRIMIIPALPPK
jgi:hypothetical protein